MSARLVCCLALLAWLSGCSLFGSSPRSDAVTVVYEGNREMSRSELDGALLRFFQDFPGATFKKSAVDDAAYDLERFYLAAGFPFVVVRYRLEEPEGAVPRAVFTIEEGPRTELDSLRFAGNTAFTSKQLAAVFEPEARGLFESSKHWYVENDVNANLDALAQMYQLEGYRDVTFDPPKLELDARRQHASILVSIHEGTRYRVGAIEVEGGDPRVTDADVRSAWREFIGRPYYERLAVQIQGRIEEVFADRGFVDVRVTRTRHDASPDGTVALGFRVVPGPCVTVGAIKVAGTNRTSQSFVRRRMTLREGEIYSREKERTSFGRLYRSGLFDRVSIRAREPGKEEPAVAPPGQAEAAPAVVPEAQLSVVRPVDVEVTESPSIETFVEPGWGSYEKLRLSAGAREKNLFGSGRILDARGTVGRIAQSGTVSLIDPWFFGTDIVSTLSVFGNRRQEPSFERLELGTGYTLTQRFSGTVEGSLGYEYRRSNIAHVEVLDAEAQDALDNVNISEVLASATIDGRDNYFNPRDGQYTKISQEYGSEAIGSQLEFARTRLSHADYFSFDSATTLAVSERGGVIVPFGSTDTIPLQERFFNGGENTVRSFREGELGPKDSDGNPLGGEGYTVLNVELRRRLKGSFEGAVFYDVGNVVPKVQDYLQFPDMRQGIGLGLRYTLPVGPIRLDGAINPHPGDGEANAVLHFSLGMAF